MKPSLRSLAVLAVMVGCTSAAAALWRVGAPFDLGQDVAARARPGDIRMFSSVSCVYCHRAARWFDWHGIAYERCEIELDDACRAEFLRRRGNGTPLLVVRGEQQTGFSPQLVAAALH